MNILSFATNFLLAEKILLIILTPPLFLSVVLFWCAWKEVDQLKRRYE